MVSFNPQFLEVKEQGRIEQARIAGLSLEAAAPYFSVATHKNFQKNFNAFVTAFPQEAKIISDDRPDGVGPGEMIAYFLFDNIHLGGKNSHTDLWMNGKEFVEVKGGDYTKKTNTLDNFKISKDGDPAVTQLMAEVKDFNETYKKITGKPLNKWNAGAAGVTTIEEWSHLDLKKLAQQFKGVSRAPIPVFLDPATQTILTETAETLISLHDKQGLKKVLEFTLAEHEISVDNKASTLKKIIDRWRKNAFENYLVGKNVALINTRSLQMMFFGHVTEEMIGLYCIHRNQPWARIYLP
jgi:hypothetical protein